MSNIQYAFINKDKIPDRKALQSTINNFGFDLQLDSNFTPFEDEGFSPCIFYGENDIGFEIDYYLADEITEDDEDFKEIAGENDFCISMSWGGSMKDCASVMIVCSALAKDFGAVISYGGDKPDSLEKMISDTKLIISDVTVKKVKRVNVYNKFLKKVETNLAEYLKPYGYRYIKKEKILISFYNELVFKISFDKAGYGSRIELIFEAYLPLLGLTYNINSADCPCGGGSITNFKWNIQQNEMKDIDKELDVYIEDIKYLFKNYIYVSNSEIINSYNLDDCIFQEYNSRYDCDSTDVDAYVLELQNSGMSQEDWTDENTEICQQFQKIAMEKEFPFAPIKKELLKSIDKNRPQYEKSVNEHLQLGYTPLKFDNNILPLNLHKLLFSDIEGKKIIELLTSWGYSHIDNKNIMGAYEAVNFKHNSNHDRIIRVLLLENLFLEFEVYGENDYYEKVLFYNESPLRFGWFIGTESKLKTNIDIAIEQLKVNLKL